MPRKNNAGQILLIVMLTMATLTTIALSAVSRSITQVEVTTREQESVRAFSAAEAGLEDALVNLNIGQNTGNTELDVTTSGTNTATVSEYLATVNRYPSANQTDFVYPLDLYNGENGTVWFVTKNGNNYEDCTSSNPCLQGDYLDICWGRSDYTIQNTAVFVSIVYDDDGSLTDNTSDLKVANYAFDSIQNRGNGFVYKDPSARCNISVDGSNFTYNHFKRIIFSDYSGNVPRFENAERLSNINRNQILYMTVKILYNTNGATQEAQNFAVKLYGSDSTFAPQGRLVSSTGQAGNSTRKVEAYIMNSTIPSVFDAAMFSGSGISK